jgi:hypothetical protein
VGIAYYLGCRSAPRDATGKPSALEVAAMIVPTVPAEVFLYLALIPLWALGRYAIRTYGPYVHVWYARFRSRRANRRAAKLFMRLPPEQRRKEIDRLMEKYPETCNEILDEIVRMEGRRKGKSERKGQ